MLQALHRTWPPVADAAQELAADLGHPVQVNAYVTPPQNRGFDDHYDVHDVFVLQVTGEKHWQVRPPVVESPLRDQPWTDHRDAVRRAAQAPPTLDAVLAPGDCLYVPRGWLHSATALGGTSIHLTMGVHVWTRRQLADDLVRAAGRRLDADPARARLARRWASTRSTRRRPPRRSPASGLPSLPRLDAVTDEELAAALARRVRAAQRAEPIGALRPARGDRRPRHVWRPRRHLAARWEAGRRRGVDPGDPGGAGRRADRPPGGCRRGAGRRGGCRRPRPRGAPIALSRRPVGARVTNVASGRGAHHEPGGQHGLGRGTGSPAIRASSRSAITRPISSTGWCTEVRAGSVCRQTAESSKPDERDVVGHPQPGLAQHPQRADGHQVGGGEHGIRAIPVASTSRIARSPLSSL